ncbi:MAG: type VI secretion system tube protein Hcp [Betaproteobacteria bacterium]|jgi:type VI secretion system secreted protein Hcp|nr:type VI secretion system tube protein Hcp [Betaproteobacteria bacterium]MBK7590621.1 type VI secretion system tube protein Hcp [Betaproteobacteria bacterium]MBK7745158.1 type VI secretion system tube protein Hcp [Betaproteobacteria bacterium]MBK8689819.1 type VI secretion system tube protein Hcp [Betaproteobacteria bacterium]MBK9674077.1 type VI secretion system tube protein Hcp [Betaproteobacteria bacterium]
MNITKSLAAATVALGLVSTTPAFAAEVITLNIKDIGQSNVLAWSWGASNGGTTHLGGGGGAGRAAFQDLSLTRAVDSQSPSFLKGVATGDSYPVAILQDGPVKITLMNVLVTSLSTGGVAAKNKALTENITLNFSEFIYEVNGATFTWDIAANSP